MNKKELIKAVNKATYVFATVEGRRVRLVKSDLIYPIKHAATESFNAAVQGDNLFIGP